MGISKREGIMNTALTDLSIFEKFDFKLKPVGIKFLLYKPDGIGKLEKNLSICEMIREAQQSPVLSHIGQDRVRCPGPGSAE